MSKEELNNLKEDYKRSKDYLQFMKDMAKSRGCNNDYRRLEEKVKQMQLTIAKNDSKQNAKIISA